MLQKTCLLLALLWSGAVSANCEGILSHDVRPIGKAQAVRLCDDYQEQVLLVVNVASRCGFTPQYEGLEKLYKKFKDEGLVVLGFPSDDFGSQEPGTEKEIVEFCRLNYGVSFPMFEKVHAAKRSAIPLYRDMAEQAGEYPVWNFHKYLINREGRVEGSFPSAVKPLSAELTAAIERLL